jgi:hypothetical protein
MTFREWVARHGLQFTLNWWGLANDLHAVFVIRRGHTVGLRIGDRFMGSEPLGSGQFITEAIDKLSAAVLDCYKTAEFIID